MNLLVCISNVPDTTTKVKFADNNTRLETTGIQWVINPWDELSLTRALELKDDASTGVRQVTVAHVGLAGAEPTIRKALAMGADNAYRVNIDPADAFQVALGLAQVFKAAKFDVVMCGIESSDFNGSNVGSMLAEILDIASVSGISSLKIENGAAIITREIDSGQEVLEAKSPFVAIVQKGIAKEPRIAAMRGIMMARSKPITVVDAPEAKPLGTVIGYELPQARVACKFVEPENAGQLIELLQNEAKVI